MRCLDMFGAHPAGTAGRLRVLIPLEVKALQMGVRLCEAARADSCLRVWQGWPTDRLLDGLDEGHRAVQLCIWIQRGLGNRFDRTCQQHGEG